MPDCLAAGQSGTGMKKTDDARTGLDYAAAVRHFFWSSYKSRTELMDAGMPMPSYVSLALKDNASDSHAEPTPPPKKKTSKMDNIDERNHHDHPGDHSHQGNFRRHHHRGHHGNPSHQCHHGHQEHYVQ